MLKLELSKIFRSRFLKILFFLHVFIYPSTSLLFAYLDHKDPLQNDLDLFHQLSVNLIAYAQSIFFIPLWIIVQTSKEFDSGFVSRHVINSSRQDYFYRKLLYCLVVAGLFTCLGIITILASNLFLSVSDQVSLMGFIFFWGIQQIFSYWLLGAILLAMTMWVRSIRFSLAVFIGWGIVESIAYKISDKLLGVKLYLLPLHAVKLVSSKNGEGGVTNYINPFLDSPSALIIPILYTFMVLIFTYTSFLRRDLTALSD